MKNRYGVVIAVIIGLLLLRYSGIGDTFTLAKLKTHSDYLENYVAQHYLKSILLYIFSYSFVVACLLPFAALFTLAGGFLFGALAGTFYTNIGATVGATGAFLMVRYVIGEYIQKRYQQRLANVNAALHRNEISFLLFIHIIPIIPFPIINILIGLTKVSTWRFMWTTAVGILPVSLIYSFAGEQLATIDAFRDVLSPNVVLAFVLLASFALLPAIINWYKRIKGVRL